MLIFFRIRVISRLLIDGACMISIVINVIRFMLGMSLIAISLKAYSKGRSTAMLYLIIGFSALTLGDLFSAVYFAGNPYLDNLISDAFDIPGFLAMIIAIKKC